MEIKCGIVAGDVAVDAQPDVTLSWLDSLPVGDRRHRVVQAEPLRIRDAAFPEVRRDNQFERSKPRIGAQLPRIHGAFEIFQRPAGEQRLVVLGEDVVHEHQVAEPPSDYLPAYTQIPVSGRVVNVTLPQFALILAVKMIVSKIALRQQPPGAAGGIELESGAPLKPLLAGARPGSPPRG